MNNIIDIEEILYKYGQKSSFYMKAAIKEIVEAVVDKCDEHCIACTGLKSDGSLQEIKEMINYE